MTTLSLTGGNIAKEKLITTSDWLLICDALQFFVLHQATTSNVPQIRQTISVLTILIKKTYSRNNKHVAKKATKTLKRTTKILTQKENNWHNQHQTTTWLDRELGG